MPLNYSASRSLYGVLASEARTTARLYLGPELINRDAYNEVARNARRVSIRCEEQA